MEEVSTEKKKDMDIRCTVLMKKQYDQLIENGWIPEELDVVPDKYTAVFGAVDQQNNLLAVAVFSTLPQDGRELKLEYISVHKLYHRQGIGSKLLLFAVRKLKSLGGTKICCEWWGKEADIDTTPVFLQKVGFMPIMKPEHMVVYLQGQFQDSSLEKLRGKESDIRKSVVKIENYYDLRLKRLLSQYETTGFFIGEQDFHPDLCRFYIEKGVLRGAACLRFMKDGNLKTLKGYMSPEVKNPYAMTFLVSILIYDLKGKVKPGTKIYLKLYRENFYESVINLFGEGHEQYLFQEFEREL